MPDINLPSPGESPNWAPKLNTAIRDINLALDGHLARTIDVYDYGAVNSRTTSSQAALNSALSAAHDMAGEKTPVTIKIPVGSVVGDLRIQKPYISVEGPGALIGEVVFEDPQQRLIRFYASVRDIVFSSRTPTTTRIGGVRVVGAAMVEVSGCQFYDVEKAINLDTFPGVAGQQNKTINVHDCTFIDVDYALIGLLKSGNTWAAHADLVFRNNIVRPAFISHVRLDGVDGVQIDGNVFFNIGWGDSHPRKMEKADAIRIGRAGNWVHVTNNQIFEAGRSAVVLVAAQYATIQGNHIVWPGQVSQSSAILTFADPLIGPGITQVISGNIIEGATSSGIQVAGDGDASGFTITDDNAVTLYHTVNRNTYIGPGTLDKDIYRVQVNQSVTAQPRINMTHHAGSRQGLLRIKSVISHSHERLSEGAIRTTYLLTKNVSGATVIGSLYSPFDSNRVQFAGRLYITVSMYEGGMDRTAIPRLAVYEMTATGIPREITMHHESGMTEASSDRMNPAFTFSINSDGDLVAHPKVYASSGLAVTGVFNFSVIAEGWIQAGWTQADAAALAPNYPY